MMARKKEALRVAAWYLLLGGGWVLLIHVLPCLLYPVSENALSAGHLAIVAMVVAITLLLYLVIGHQLPDTTITPQGYSMAFPVRRAASMLLALALSLTVVVTSSLRLDDLVESNVRQEASLELASIVELKANLVSSWLRERLHDAALVGQDYDIAERYALELSGRDSGQSQAILRDRLEAIRMEYDYSNVILLDAHGQNPVYADDAHAYMADITQSLARKVSASGASLLSPLYVDDVDNDAHMDFIAPLMLNHGKKKEPIGAVLIQVSIERQLMPLIRAWPVPSQTAETLLAMRAGDRVVFLNTLRYADNNPLEYSKPLSTAKLIAAMALRGEPNVHEGVDYRDVRVLAATQRIKETPWVMVAKIDQDEVYASLTMNRWGLFILSVLLVILLGGLLLLSWRRQQQARIEHHYREMMEREALSRHYETVLQYANDIFLLVDSDGRIVNANTRASELTSFNHEELLGMHVSQLYSPRAREGMGQQWQLDERGKVFETEFMRKDASTFPVEVSARMIEVERKQFWQGIVRDITERRQNEQALLDEKQFSDTLTQSLPDIFFVLDGEGNLIRWNDNLMELSGRSPKQMAAANALDFVVDEDQPLAAQNIREAFETGSASTELSLALKDGIRHYTLTGTRIETTRGGRLIGIGIDITERDQAEHIIRESEARYHSLFESMLNGFAYCRMLYEDGHPSDFIYLEVNEAFEKQTGLKGVVGKRVSEVIPGLREASPELIERYGRVASGGSPDQFEIYVETLQMWFSISVYSPQAEHFVAIFDVITERKQVEEAIRGSRDLLRSVVENIPVRVFWKDRELRYLGCNTLFARDAGMQNPKQMYGKDDSQMGWKDQAELYRADDKAVMESGEAKLGFEEPQTTPDGKTIWLRTSKVPLRDANGEVSGLLGIYEDITTEKKAQESLYHLNRALKSLSMVNRTLVHSKSESELWQGVCRAVVEESGYLLAWIGYAQNDDAKSVKVMASHAIKPGYAEDIHVSWGDVPEGCGPTGMAVRTGQTQYIQDIAHDPAMAPWQEKALAYGYKASIALPLIDNGKPFGALTIYAAEEGAFNAEELDLLAELAADLSYGIHMQRTGAERDQIRAEQEQTLEKMQEGLVETVEAIAATVEMRDPYTAGHQRQVADLAVAIASKMGLDEQRTQGIFLAGIVHDLGKISIPAEILSYPGRLSEMQLMLVRSHAQVGFDILKDVHFPWPIAQMVLQHHERLDGSGYPQGLKGDEILLEAQIISVADVVEAMASHRPYRAGLGLEAGLAEIKDKRGTQFNAEVVDACISLFRDDGYVLPA